MPTQASKSRPAQAHQRGPTATALLRRIPEADHQRMGGQECLHAGALHPDAAPVDQPDLGEATGVCRAQVLVDDRAHVLGAEGVQIERVLDRQLDGVVLRLSDI